MYERFQPSPSRNSETDVRRIDSTKASITVDTAMIAKPPQQRRPPPDPVDERPDDEHERVHADDVEADHGEDVGLCVVMADDDVPGQVHDAVTITAKLAIAAMTAEGTPGRSRISRRGAAGASASRPLLTRSASWSSSAIDRGSGRMFRAMINPTSAIADATNHGITRVSSSKSFPAKAAA